MLEFLDDPPHTKCSARKLWDGFRCVDPCTEGTTFVDGKCEITQQYRDYFAEDALKRDACPANMLLGAEGVCVPRPTCHPDPTAPGSCRMCDMHPYNAETCEGGSWITCDCEHPTSLCANGLLALNGECVRICDEGSVFDHERFSCRCAP